MKVTTKIELVREILRQDRVLVMYKWLLANERGATDYWRECYHRAIGSGGSEFEPSAKMRLAEIKSKTA